MLTNTLTICPKALSKAGMLEVDSIYAYMGIYTTTNNRYNFMSLVFLIKTMSTNPNLSW